MAYSGSVIVFFSVYFDLLISVRQSEIVTQSSLNVKILLFSRQLDPYIIIIMKVWGKGGFEGASELLVNNLKSNQVGVASLFLSI